MPRYALVAVTLLVVACGPRPHPVSKPTTPASGPFYSTVPCADQCGTDTNCSAACTPVSNQMPPPSALKR
jgi:hypothetical protein